LNNFQLKYQQFGRNTLLVSWPEQISEAILEDVLGFKASLQSQYKEKIICWHAYQSLAIQFKQNIHNFESVVKTLKKIYNQSRRTRLTNNRKWKIPVCYESEFAPDINFICNQKGLSEEKLVNIHTQPTYLVYFTGFLPGFPYLGGLDETLYIPRKESPSLKVPKGAVAIGGKQTGIYPQESPGGWHVIGQTPIEIFRVTEKPPVYLLPGDSLEFYSVNAEAFFQIKEEVETQKFNYKSMLQNG